MSKGWFFLVALLYAQFSFAQTKQSTSQQQVWLGYFNQTRFSNKWGIWLDAHIRTKDHFFTGLYQDVVRAGVTYYVNDVTRITAGYAFMNHFPGDNHKNVSQPEHRPWQQISWQVPAGKKTIVHRLRLEQRYRRKILNDSTLAPGYNFNFRARYNFSIQVPLSRHGNGPHTFSLIAQDEVMVNFGKAIVYNYFDQNRFFAGLAYHVNASGQLQAGYMNLFQQLSSGSQYRYAHILRLFYIHNLDLRKKIS